MTTILNNRLNNFVSHNSLLSENQAGFRKDHSCTDHIFSLHAIVEHRLVKPKQKLYALFIDLKAAFDSVNHCILWSRLQHIGCSSKFLLLLQAMYAQANAH